MFTNLGGHSVILCLGWAYDRDESITSRGPAAARPGWQLIDGDPAAWVAMIAQPDAASAAPPSPSLRAPTTSPMATPAPRLS